MNSSTLGDVTNKSKRSRRRSKRHSLLSEAEKPPAKRERSVVNNQSSSMIKSMWEHAVTFMRGALDAILFDRSKAESVVTTPITGDGVYQQQGTPDPVIIQSPASGGGSKSVISCGTDCRKQTPPTPGTYSISRTPKELIKCSSLKHPALRRYYEESPEALVQNTKSFSFLLQERAKVAATGLNSIPELEISIPELQVSIPELEVSVSTPTHQKLSESQTPAIPAPPPLPPVAPIPPATPTLPDAEGRAPPSDKYTIALHSMQNRLQRRIKNKGVAAGQEKQKAADTSVKVTVCSYCEFSVD